ncbi:MAG: COX15/CtaA family protein [Myxococcales bacterium]|nr:COX15/CtaA family protein [Myxococcales bacterium]
MSRFQKLAWATLGYTLLVIVWGAYVRASGSGAGCGAHWPLCNGVALPVAPAQKTVIELSHRVTSGLVLFFALALMVQAFRSFPRGALPRIASVAVLLLTIVEALIGRFLVLFELVAQNASLKRALSMVLHLGNTFLLLAAIALAIHGGRVPPDASREVSPSRLPLLQRALLPLVAAGLMVVGMSGGIAALGDTLFPATSFSEGLAAELQSSAHVLLRLRILHPLFASAVSLAALALAALMRGSSASPVAVFWSRAVTALVVVQFALGLVNVALLAPVWLQLVHLFVADGLWLAFVFLWAEARTQAPRAPARASADAGVELATSGR